MLRWDSLPPMNPATRLASRVLPLVPRGAGDRRLARAVFARGTEGVAVRRLSGGARVRLDLSDWPQAQAYLLGRYDPATVQFVVDRLPQGGVFVDGGAHIGLVSLQVAARRPDATVYAFEPHPLALEGLRANVALNPSATVHVRPAALSSAAGTLSFSLDRHKLGTGDATVPTVTLEQALAADGVARVDVLKLDVEGHELAALQGAEPLLAAQAIGAVTLEAMDAHGDTRAPGELLERHGYWAVPLPDVRPAAVRRLRAGESENVAYLAPR